MLHLARLVVWPQLRAYEVDAHTGGTGRFPVSPLANKTRTRAVGVLVADVERSPAASISLTLAMEDDNPSSVEAQIADLRRLIAKDQVVAIIGTGVSLAATCNATAALWKGLLEKGIAHAEHFVTGLPKRWARRQQEALEDAVEGGDLVEILNVATQLSIRLAAPDGGEYINWLRNSLSRQSLPLTDSSVIEALAALHIPLITTNYDELIEQATGMAGVTWKEKHKVPRIIRREDRAVVHLHGKWDVPDSVVLGIRDYDEVKEDEHTRAVMQCLWYANSLLFVGCGEGLNDPNFRNFLQWLGRVRASDEYRNYRLALRSEVAELQKQHPPEQRLFVLPYGDRHEALADFLRDLKPSKAARADRSLRRVALSEVLDAHIEHLSREHVQRDMRLEEMFGWASRGNCRGVLLLGDPGAGKTTAVRQLCWQLASGETAPTELGLPGGTLPVFVRLRNLQPADLAGGWEPFVDRETEIQDGDCASPGAELRHFAGSLLWIFDGLDEVVDEDVRVAAAAWFGGLLAIRPGDRVLVTGRYQGIEGKVEVGDDFTRFEVQPLDDGQAGDFVQTWFRVAYQRLGLDRKDAQQKSHALLALLHQPAYRIGSMADGRTTPTPHGRCWQRWRGGCTKKSTAARCRWPTWSSAPPRPCRCFLIRAWARTAANSSASCARTAASWPRRGAGWPSSSI